MITSLKARKKRQRQKQDENYCPICGQYMEIRCIGHREKPFVDGFTYDAICFVCFSIPKCYEYKIGENGEEIWEGPFFDPKHLYTPKELIEESICDDIKTAKQSHKSLLKKIKLGKKKGKIG